MITRGRPSVQHPAKKLLLLAVVIVSLLVVLPPADAASKKQTTSVKTSSINDKNKTKIASTEKGMDGLLIEDNPDYLEQDLDDSSSDDDDSDSDVSDDESDTTEKTGSCISKKSSKKSKKKTEKAKGPVATLKKHKSRIVLAVALIAFRREILALLLQGLRSSKNHVSITEVLKLLLFVDTIWSMKNGGSGLFSSAGEDGGTSIVSFLKNIGGSNPAYIPPITQHYAFERINEYFVKDAMALNKAIQSKHEGLSWPSSTHQRSSFSPKKAADWQKKAAPKPFSKTSQTAIIVDWTKLDSALTNMKQMREQVSFLLSEYRSLAMIGDASVLNKEPPNVEVVLLLESPGGSVAEYGLAGSLLMQLRDTPGVTLTICVDKVAASGGYMLCCTASPGKLFAAPFAMVGSIGVIGQLINIQDLLTGWGIHPLVFRGGKDKAPVGLLGDILPSVWVSTCAAVPRNRNASLRGPFMPVSFWVLYRPLRRVLF